MTSDDAEIRLAPKLIDSLYTEAMVLADEARSYFDRYGKEERDRLEPILRVGLSCESLKVTTRLMQVIAWLLTQRAVQAGEIGTAQARSPASRLGDAAESDPELLLKLPDNATALINASRDLYARVQRLDEGGAVSFEPHPSPARSLLSRLERSL